MMKMMMMNGKRLVSDALRHALRHGLCHYVT